MKNLRVNVLDYQPVNPVLFEINKSDGSEGTIENHIFRGHLADYYPSSTILQYCGDDDRYEPIYNEEYVFTPVGTNITLQYKDFDYFLVAIDYSHSGLYTINYQIDFYADGKLHTKTSDEFTYYFPNEDIEYYLDYTSLVRHYDPDNENSLILEFGRTSRKINDSEYSRKFSNGLTHLYQNIEDWFNTGVIVDETAQEGIRYFESLRSFISLEYHTEHN